MSQTTNNDQVPMFCLANAIDAIKPLLIKYAEDKLPTVAPKTKVSPQSPAISKPAEPTVESTSSAPPPSYSQATREINEERQRDSEIKSVQSSTPDPDTVIDKDAQLAKGANISGGAKTDCSKEPDDLSHVAAKIDMSQNGGLENMIKTVIILPGFFQGNIPYPNVGKEMNGDTISISSIIGLVLLCNKTGQVRQLPLYRHTFVSTTPLVSRSQNHVFSLFPLLQTDEFLKNATTIEECFGQRPQNTQQYMFSKAHVRAVITQTFPDGDFPWFGFDNDTQKVATDIPVLTEIITKSNDIFAEMRAAARDMKLSGDCQLPTVTGKTEEITGVYNKIDKKGLLPPWMKPGTADAPPMLATGWGTPVKPSAVTVEAFMCKGRLQGFLNAQSIATYDSIGGDSWMDVSSSNPTGPISATSATLPLISKAVKEYISSYRTAFGSDVVAALNSNLATPIQDPVQTSVQSGGEPVDMNNGQRKAIVTRSGFIGNTAVQDKLGDKAIDWLNEINQKMIAYNAKPSGEIIERQYILEDIQMKIQVLALILAAVTGMAPTIIPKVSRENIPGDPNLKKGGTGKKHNATNKKRHRNRSKTHKRK